MSLWIILRELLNYLNKLNNVLNGLIITRNVRMLLRPADTLALVGKPSTNGRQGMIQVIC